MVITVVGENVLVWKTKHQHMKFTAAILAVVAAVRAQTTGDYIAEICKSTGNACEVYRTIPNCKYFGMSGGGQFYILQVQGSFPANLNLEEKKKSTVAGHKAVEQDLLTISAGVAVPKANNGFSSASAGPNIRHAVKGQLYRKFLGVEMDHWAITFICTHDKKRSVLVQYLTDPKN